MLCAMPDADLIAAERRLHSFLIELDALWSKWPKGKTALQRAKIGQRIGYLEGQVEAVHGLITDTEAVSPAGAAVKLRRVLARVDETAIVGRLVASALSAIEA